MKIHDRLGFREPPIEERAYEQRRFVDADYYIGIFEKEADSQILRKICDLSQPLSDIARPCSGYNPYETGKGQAPGGGPHTRETVKSRPYHSDKRLGDGWKPEIVGRNLRRYSLTLTGERWIRYGPWLAAPRDPSNFVGKRILVQEITGGTDRRIVATYYDRGLYHSRDVIPVKTESEFPHPFYILGIINSWLITWYHSRKSPKAKKRLFPKVLVSDLKKLPIRIINCGDPTALARHDRLVELVGDMLKVHSQLADAKTAHDRTVLQRQIDATDRQIDQLVYELYDLAEEEIEIVEGRVE